MTSELSKTYDPTGTEDAIYNTWLKEKAFHADPTGEGKSYCIVIPPPNVTAALHLGHALNNTLQDVLIRWRRMQRYNTLWMPGTDHAGIATQTVVEKRLLAQDGKRRTDFQRDEFVQLVRNWKDEYEQRITNQLKTIGCSCDWDRQRFTMDEVCARAVREVFFKLFADGLIYRGKRLVNWDPATQTVLADDEVEHETVKGFFWNLQYPLSKPVEVDGETLTHVTVATTRPETMLGDTAIAMNPNDPRAEYLVGKTVRLPIVGREIPIVADDHVVLPDPDSDDEKARHSTGFLKVTPAHDPNDYQIGERHLDEIAAVVAPEDAEDPRPYVFVNVMAPDGTISDRHGWEDARDGDAEQFLGMDRFEAREAIVEWFRQEQLLGEVRHYDHEVGHSYRSHVPIEPYLSDQWYVAVKLPVAHLAETFGSNTIGETDVPANSLAGLALKPLTEGRLNFTPDRYGHTYRTWLENLRDWPISRQLWWGHRIPVWTLDIELPSGAQPGRRDLHNDADVLAALDAVAGGPFHDTVKPLGRYELRIEEHPDQPGWVRAYLCTGPDSEPLEKRIEEMGFRQDPDVLDTWFSSALWPFSTLGWPKDTPALRKYYPGDVLCTAREIITLWVSRMVMMGQYCLGDIPFSDVFIHAMIQDGQGRKMSKSLGNGIDPLDICDSHGADAMRFTMASMTTQTQDVRMPVEEITLPDGRTVNSSPKFDIGRNFCNKLWNASRFALMNLKDLPRWSTVRPHEDLADRWILSRLNATIRDVTAALEEFRYNELADRLYHFVWDDFCDWYLEACKHRIAAEQGAPKAVLAHALDSILRLLHPVTPFITERIWRALGDAAPRRGPEDRAAAPLLVRAHWPVADTSAIHDDVERQFALVQDVIREIRNIRTQNNVAPSEKVEVILETADVEQVELLESTSELMGNLAGLKNVTVTEDAGELPSGAAAGTIGSLRIVVLDVVDLEAELQRLTKQKETLAKGIGGIEGKLANENFVSKAPAQVVQRERDRLEQLRQELAGVEDALAALQD
jgi:valyl-tRNA synthetase